MKCLGKIAFCLASSVALTGLCAGHASSSNPYEPIAVRNIFDLNPPQSAPPPPQDTPVKLTPNGIMDIFGTLQVLFYADVPPRPPMPPSQKSYILSEGQQQDDIEVKHIDQKNGIITFSNHGVIQEIPLAKAGPITTPTPVVMRTAYTPPPAPANNFGNNPGGNPGLAARFGQNRNFGNADRSFGNAANSGYADGNLGNAGNAPPQRQLTSEEQMLMIAAQHAEAQKRGDPIANIYPRTEMDEAAGVTPNTAQGPR